MSKFTTSAGVLLSVGLIGTFSLPAYATPIAPSEMTERTGSIQTLVLEEIKTTPLTMEIFEETVEPAVIASAPKAVASTPSSYIGGGLLAAARSQIGWGQDCTALVENSLRMIGIAIGDAAPMGFAAYGVQVDPSQAQPGDIMMRGGHVAIYAGNGVAIHGGFGGSTVETSIDGSPYNYAVIVRV